MRLFAWDEIGVVIDICGIKYVLNLILSLLDKNDTFLLITQGRIDDN